MILFVLSWFDFFDLKLFTKSTVPSTQLYYAVNIYVNISPRLETLRHMSRHAARDCRSRATKRGDVNLMFMSTKIENALNFAYGWRHWARAHAPTGRIARARALPNLIQRKFIEWAYRRLLIQGHQKLPNWWHRCHRELTLAPVHEVRCTKILRPTVHVGLAQAKCARKMKHVAFRWAAVRAPRTSLTRSELTSAHHRKAMEKGALAL